MAVEVVVTNEIMAPVCRSRGLKVARALCPSFTRIRILGCLSGGVCGEYGIGNEAADVSVVFTGSSVGGGVEGSDVSDNWCIIPSLIRTCTIHMGYSSRAKQRLICTVCRFDGYAVMVC